MLRAGIFGYPISHSVSPPMHQAAFDRAGMDAVYEAWETPPDALGAGVARLRADGFLGANVTVPHKRAVMAHLDDVDALATRIGAVNTIVNREGRLWGTNTDASGFAASLEAGADLELGGIDAVLFGAGGAARAAAHALAAEGAASLAIVNRTVERALLLADEIAALGVSASALAPTDAALASVCRRAALLVNSTSVGMAHGPAERESPIPREAIRAGCVVYDMVYTPPETPLLTLARDAGATAIGGLPMLVYQGAAAWSLWTGEEAPIEVMFAAARRALGL